MANERKGMGSKRKIMEKKKIKKGKLMGIIERKTKRIRKRMVRKERYRLFLNEILEKESKLRKGKHEVN